MMTLNELLEIKPPAFMPNPELNEKYRKISQETTLRIKDAENKHREIDIEYQIQASELIMKSIIF